jgi:hypothetical protein
MCLATGPECMLITSSIPFQKSLMAVMTGYGVMISVSDLTRDGVPFSPISPLPCDVDHSPPSHCPIKNRRCSAHEHKDEFVAVRLIILLSSIGCPSSSAPSWQVYRAYWGDVATVGWSVLVSPMRGERPLLLKIAQPLVAL